MRARKSKRSRSVIIDRNRRYGLSRPPQTRSTLPIVVVVCDDAKTSVGYFNLLKREVKERLTLTVVRNPCDRATPADVIDCAKKRERLLSEKKSHDQHDKNSVWALIDLEKDPARRKEGLAAKEAGEKARISVALSDPCYEVWTLLHLVDTGETFADCNAVLSRVEIEWQKKFGQEFRPKAQADYSKILPYRTAAAARAKQHREADDPSWTDVYLVSDAIDLLSK